MTDTALAAPRTMSRRRELGATSARSLLLTVLGEFVLPAGSPVWTQTLLDMLRSLEVEEKSARQALARTASEGLLSSERVGRRVRWSLTPAGRRLLSEGAERIYGFGARPTSWDRRWLVVIVSVPESQRQLRHRLRTRLSWAGLGSPVAGVWVSPNADKQGEVDTVLTELGLVGTAFSFVGPFGASGEEAELVGQAWDLGVVEATYEQFVEDFADAAPQSQDEALRWQTRLVHAWRRFPFLDPQLPAELLPPRWAGARAAELFHQHHGAWAQPARYRWQELVHGAAG